MKLRLESVELVNENYEEVKRIKEYNKLFNRIKRTVKKILPIKIKNR